MRNLLMAGLMAAVALPIGAAPAMAQSHHGARHHDRNQDRRANRHERRADRAQRRADIRHHRREVRRDRHHYRREVRRDRHIARHERRANHRAQRRWSNHAWRDYRRSHRSVYRRGHWNAPFRYHRYRAGIRMRPGYFSSRYYIGDPGYFRLPPTGRYQRWVCHYDDVLLVDIRNGMVLRVYRNFFW